MTKKAKNTKTKKMILSYLKKSASYTVSTAAVISIVIFISYAFSKLTHETVGFTGYFIFFGFSLVCCLLLMLFVSLKQVVEGQTQLIQIQIDMLGKENKRDLDMFSGVNNTSFSGSIVMFDNEGNEIDEKFSSKEEYNAIIKKYFSKGDFSNFFNQIKKDPKKKENISKPISDMSEEELEILKNKALDEQNFELAVQIRDELEKRKIGK